MESKPKAGKETADADIYTKQGNEEPEELIVNGSQVGGVLKCGFGYQLSICLLLFKLWLLAGLSRYQSSALEGLLNG